MTRITPIPAPLSHYQVKGRRSNKVVGSESDEGIMDQDAFRVRETTCVVKPHGESKPSRRRRPMTQAQEFTVLAIAFAIGAGVQAVYLLHGVVALH